MATIHASSARQALVKLCTLPLLAAENIGAAFVVTTVASCVGLVVHLTLGRDGTRRVAEIIAVTGRVENSVIETETVYVRAGGQVMQSPMLDDGRNGLPWEA
jgi:pilus assembly protein CpaF